MRYDASMPRENFDIGDARTEVGERRLVQIGPYLLGPPLGSGGMGVVFAGRHVDTGREVAVKLMRGGLGGSAGAQRFLREARALASLSHPAIVEYVDHGVTDEGQAFLVMERLIGEDLQTRLQRGTLPIHECIELGILLTDALVAAHAQGMVHRDIKPSNIFLANGKVGNARLLDFGVARTSDDAHSLTRTGTMLGTVGYMSPEQARGDPDIDGRADLYSLGSVLYECLTGQQVFSGEHAMAVLAKILLDAPPQVSALRPEVSPPLAALIDALLAKDREARPGCASALLTLLSGLDPGHEGENAGSRVPGGSGVTLEEQRVYCLLLVRLRPIQLDERGATNADVHTQYAAIASIAADFGAVFSPMLGGMGLLSVQIDAPATDVALQAARCALTLRNQFPAIAQCLATGRGQRQGASFVGRLIDTAMAVEGQALAGAVLVDAATVSLLQDRFTLEGSDDRTFLGVERDVLVTRMLLGRPAPFVGRARELGLLQGLVHEAIEESQSCAALIIAGPGYGKSRLRHELHRSLREEGLDLLTLVGRGSPMAQGAALSVLRDAIRREVGSFDGPVSEQRERLRRRVGEALPAAERDRVTAFLGELAGIPADSNAYAKLALARNDALVMVDAMRVAWLDWLRAECRRRPVLLIVEDLHWGDAATVAFIDAALRDLRGSPFIVLALARPEVQGVFPRVWSASRPTTLELTPISQRAGEALARQVLGPAANEATVAALVLHADGNPFFLEELLRAVASGASTTLPDSVLGVIQDRLQALDDESRRVLRAASVFGGGFTEGAVAAVLAQRTHPARARLATLVEQELISREFRADKAYYRFRHALVRDASHAMLTDADRTLAHRLAAGWLADQEGHEPMVVAEHFRLGDCRPEAVLWFHRAAEQALDGGDLAATVDRADEAIACGAEGATLADLRLLQAEARIWSGSLEQAERWAGEALEGLRAGSMRWYIALQKAIYCASVRGALDAALVWVDQAEQQQADDDAQVGPLLCLCEATLAMHVAGRPDLTDGLLARVEQHASRIALPPGYLGHVFRARAIVRGATGRYEETHTEAQRAVAEFTAAGDLRSAARMGVFAAHAIILLGAYEEAEQLLRAVDASATRLDAEQVLIYCRGTLGWLLSLTSRPAEGRALLGDVLALCEHRGDPRAEGVFGIHLGVLDACDGDIAGAEVRITRGLQLVTGQMQIVPWGQASLARVYLAAGRTAEASALAAAILDLLTASDVYVNQEAFVLATVLDCLHEESAARHAAIGLAAQRIRRNLANIISPARRRQFLAIPDCKSLIEIARRAGLMVDDLLAERYEDN